MNTTISLAGRKGIALILIIFLMMMCSLVAVTAFSLLSAAEESAGDFQSAVQARAVAAGGKEWYLEQLQNDNNWANEVNQANITLGSGNFDVTIKSASTGSVSFLITGKITGLSGQTVRSQMSMTAKRLPPAAHFAVFWGRDTGAAFLLNNGTTINGDLWSIGTGQINSGCSVTGISYCPIAKDITGVGSFTKVRISLPNPVMPQISTTFYNNFISASNTNITTYGTGSDGIISSNMNLTGGFYGYRSLQTTGNITISGNGTIVASRDIELHSSGSAVGTLTISPSGGNIYILAGWSLTVNSSHTDTNVIINGDANNKVYLYSRDNSSLRLVRIQKNAATTTTVDSAVVVGQRRIIVEGGSQVKNSTLYVSDVTDTNNVLQITGSGTAVGTPGNPCSVISVSGRNPGLVIDTNAAITGFVYHYGATTGTTQITGGAVVTGSVVASQFAGNSIDGSTITYSEAALPAAPAGFESFVSADIDSWDDK